MAGKTSTALEAICRSVVESLGYELVDLQFVKEYQKWVLRVFIDHDEGIGLDDCEKVSKALSSALDEEDPIPHNYVLEVSSPGLDRPLKNEKDFERFKGYRIKVKTFSPIEGRKTFDGYLVGLNDGKIVLNVESEEMQIPRDQVSSVRLVPEF